MYSKYLVMIDVDTSLPSRKSMVEIAWGEDVPISFVQDNEVFNEASYLDFKVNKWEVNQKWSEMQDEEPWIRLEIIRDIQIKDYVSENKLTFSFDYKRYYLVALELDDGWQEIDQALLARVVVSLAKNKKVYAFDDNEGYIDCTDTLSSLPSKKTVRKSIFLDKEEP